MLEEKRLVKLVYNYNIVFRSLFSAVFLKYATVGVLGTIIDVGSLALMVTISGIDPTSSSIMYVFVTAAFLLAVINNFFLNRAWTFGLKEKKNGKRQFVKFLLTSLVGLLLTNLLMLVFVQVLLLWYIFGKLITSAIILSWNFLANKYWTFRSHTLPRAGNEDGKSYEIDLSIVVPAYNEESRIGDTLDFIHAYLQNEEFNSEVIVVSDGSTDETCTVVKEIAATRSYLRLIDLGVNKGKGAAVRTGVLASQGAYVLFTDADNSTPIEEVSKFWEAKKASDILIGSRYLENSNVVVSQPWYRVMIGRSANFLIQLFLVDGVRDTQCGFKLLNAQAAHDIFSRMKVDGFGFDMELLALAELLGYSILELPVSWYNSADSRVRPVKDALRTLGDLITIKLGIWGGGYGPRDAD